MLDIIDKGSIEDNLEEIYKHLDLRVQEMYKYYNIKGILIELAFLTYDTYEILKSYRKKGIIIPFSIHTIMKNYKNSREELKLNKA